MKGGAEPPFLLDHPAAAAARGPAGAGLSPEKFYIIKKILSVFHENLGNSCQKRKQFGNTVAIAEKS